MLHLRRKRPTRVIRGSSWILNSGAAALHLVEVGEGEALRLGVGDHRAELHDPERPARAAVARLAEEDRSLRVQPDGQCRYGQHRRQCEQPRCRGGDVEGALERPHRPRELHRGQAHDGHALDVLECGVGREQLVEVRDDREMHVRATDLAHEVERALVRPLREREHDPVDAQAVDHGGQLVGAAEHVGAGRVVIDEADELEAVLRVRGDLALERAPDVAGAHDQRAAGRHDARQQPRPHDPAQHGHCDHRQPEEHQRLERGVDEDVEALLEPLADDQQHQRTRQQRVEEVGHLVEAGRRDRARLALVEPVGREDREPAEDEHRA